MSANDAVKPVRTAGDHSEALKEIARLFDAAPGTPEADRLEVLSILTADYEQKHHTLAPAGPIELLTFAMRAQGRTQADLAQLLGSRSRASEVLNRRRHLSSEMVDKIARAWDLPAKLLAVPYTIQGGMKRKAIRAAAALAFVLTLGASAAGGLFWTYGRDLPDTAAIASYKPADITIVGPDGRLAEFRKFVPLSAIPPHVVLAFLAAEDEDYYGHGGFSIAGILRASIHNMQHRRAGRNPEGGATITQQLAKNLFLAGQAPSLERKVKEIILSRRIEEALTKDRILELYLNQIYFGGAAWGIAAASEQYFGKPPSGLSIAEAAYLAALPKAPNTYRLDMPDNLERAKQRRDWVLARMAGGGLITATAAQVAQTEPLKHEASRQF
jgi:penicillin-binding protein 1A